MQVGETLDVQHVNLVNEQYARHQLRYALVYVFVDNLVDFFPQLVCEIYVIKM